MALVKKETSNSVRKGCFLNGCCYVILSLFYDISIRFWKCANSMVFVVLHVIPLCYNSWNLKQRDKTLQFSNSHNFFHIPYTQHGVGWLSVNKVISWWSVLLVEETGVPEENNRPVARHWQTLSHNAVSSTPHHERDSKSHL